MEERYNAYSDRAPATEEQGFPEFSPVFQPASVRPGDLLSSDENGVPYRAEVNGHVHAVEGSRLVQDDPTTFFMWARCGGDIPVAEVFASNETPSCPDCDSEPRVELHDSRAQALKRVRLADLAYARARARVYRAVDSGDLRAAEEAVKRREEFKAAVRAAEEGFACLRH